MFRRSFQLVVIVAILLASFGSVGGASAWSGCASYVTVQWGDTLSGIAQQCGTTVHAIRGANPGLGWWVYAGQVLYIPTGQTSDPGYYPPSGGTYVVQWGDTLGKIAGRLGVSWRDILAANPQIQNPSLIYAGQVIYLPGGVVNPPPYNPPPYNPPPKPCNCPPTSGDGLFTLKINYKHGLQKLLVSIVKPVKGLKVQPTFHVKWNMVKIVKAKPSPPFQSFPTQFLSVVRQPLSFELVQIAASLPERDTVCQKVSDLQLKVVWSGSLVLLVREKA